MEQVPLYLVWPGMNVFLCSGRIMMGPSEDRFANIYTWVTICMITIPFIVLIVPVLWTEISPALALPPCLLFISTLMFLSLTQCSDPGVIPRKQIIQLLRNPGLDVFINDDTDLEMQEPSSYIREIKTCLTCGIIRPPRSAHCSSCGNCVMVHDHHCPFVNNCVGKNNYRYFVSFLFSIVAQIISMISGVLCFIVILAGGASDQQTVILVLLVPTGIIGLLVFGLLIYHLCLICQGKTTRESIKNTQVMSGDDDFLWMGRIQPYFNPRQFVNK